jgi:excinuclease ABC subunit C
VIERPPSAGVPDAPGSYQFLDSQGRIIYVGKAKNLRARLATYFQDPSTLPVRTRQMLAAAAHVEWIEVANEVEAVFLEYNLIQTHQPRFNVRLKDDKSYPYLAVTVSEPWPRAVVMRGRKRKGIRYFGPYAHAYAIRETLDLLLRTFPVRTCTNAKFERHERLGRPCLYAHIEKCAAPCVGAVAPEEYATITGELLRFLEGDTVPVLTRLESQMRDAAEALEFERAARLRDQLGSVRRAVERQEMVGAEHLDCDVVGVGADELVAVIHTFLVRRGRVVGRRSVTLERVEDLDDAALCARVIEQLYGGHGDGDSDVPRTVLVPVAPEDVELHEAFLSRLRGRRVRIRVPRRGSGRRLLETATRDAREGLERLKLRRAGDHNARARALTALQDALGLSEAPLRIECFDVSTIQGTETVASMTVLEDGLPRRGEYRRFRIRSLDTQDDVAAMTEALTRRFRAYLREREEGARAGKRFAYPPNLLLVDGGRAQVNAAARVLEDLGLEEIAVAGLAKRFEEVYRPGAAEPLRIPRDSEALYLLQRVRDEAHRFALAYHRQRRGRRMTASVLDGVPGLGPARRARLLREHGSVARLRQMTEADLVAIPWLPERVARALHDRLHTPPVPARGVR